MHSAPSVTYPVGRSRFAGAVLLALCGLGVAATAWWGWQADVLSWRHQLGVLTVVMASCCAAFGWLRIPEGELRWDGQTWRWPSGADGGAGRVAVHLDLQHVLLLRWESSEGAFGQWLWLARVRSPGQWNPLRRAVYSRAIPALPQAEPPAGKP